MEPKTKDITKSVIKKHQHLSKNSKIINTIVNAIQEKNGDRIISLDLRKIEESVADFFIICDTQTQIELRTIASFVEEEVWEHCGEKPFHKELGDYWTLIDYVNVVVHVFIKSERKFYDLEGLWMDAPFQEYEAIGKKSKK
ncbi:MAG TPA: ribosome silencing factor [Edaphocola sp.]|nr:ribosome silencing factor [Edaphocola sp.]